MKEEQLKLFDEITQKQEKISQSLLEYWQLYSDFGTWQYWLMASLVILPLIVLYFSIDRKKIFFLGFYGFNIHVWFAYIDMFGVRQGWWGYPFQVIPFFPSSFSLDASLAPVIFILVYQWTLNQNKNFYIYSLITSLIFAFGFKPLLVSFDLFRFYKGFNYFHLFIALIVIFFVSKMITNVFLYMQKRQNGNLLH